MFDGVGFRAFAQDHGARVREWTGFRSACMSWCASVMVAVMLVKGLRPSRHLNFAVQGPEVILTLVSKDLRH